MKRYQSYKPSNVEWIGEIPNEWGVSKYKYKLNILSGFPFKSELFDSENGFPLLRIRDITSGTIETYYNGNYDEKYIIKKGDVVIGMDGDFNIREWDNDDILLNQRCCKIQNFNGLLLKYIFYTLPFDLQIINDLTYYTTVKHLSVDDLYNINCVVPSLQEQHQIVQFLDSKTELIDKLISTKERKITLLKEQRTSLINQVVTKGLNPNVKMKDSGVEWIGEIPEHWSFVNFGRICSVRQGLQIPFDNRLSEKVDNSYEYITTQSVHNPEQYKQYILNPKPNVVCNESDILMGRTGNTGEVVTNVNGVFHNNFFLIDFNREILIKEFLVWYLINPRLREELLLLSGTTTIPDLNHGKFLSTKFIYPNKDEQNKIVDFLDSKTKEIDDLVQLEQKKIDLLKEYRQSLISEVVTGKIKVTN
jgi:type I restriction enzyme S subunit